MSRGSASTHQRLMVASMETRGATGVYDKETDSYTLRACSQSADGLRDQVASIMGVPAEKVRVITEDVGGAFGMKTTVYPEYVAALVGAKKLGRPVHWQSTRSEAFVSDCPGARRGHPCRARARRQGQVHRLARAAPVQPGRLYRQRRRQHQHQQFRALLSRHVSDSEDRRRRRLLFLQQGADRALSRRRTSRRRTTRSSARWRKPRASSRWTRCGCARRTSFRRRPCRSRRRSTPTTAATSPASSTRRSSLPTTPISTSASARRQNARNIAASACPACSSMPAPRRWKRRR